MMKRFFLFLTCFFVFFALCSGRAGAQEVTLGHLFDPGLLAVEDDEEKALTRWYNRYFKRDKEKKEEVEVGWFVGPMFMFFNFDPAPFSPMTSDRGLDDFTGETFVWGVKGGFIRKSWRVGGLYLIGGQNRRERVYGQKRSAGIDFYGGGVFFEFNREYRSREELKYPVRIPFLREGYLIGCMVGTGRLTLEAKGLDMGPGKEWIVRDPLNVAYPYIGIWSSPYDWLWVQLDVGYLYFDVDTEDKKFRNAGKRMVDEEFTGGVQVGLKITFGDNPNFPNP